MLRMLENEIIIKVYQSFLILSIDFPRLVNISLTFSYIGRKDSE